MGATMGKSGGNFLDALPSQGTLHVVMLGLDSAGKTTALYRLKFDQYLNTVPTIGFNCEKVQGTVGKAKGVQFLVWDVGGQEKLRPLWRSYTRCTDGILFVVDSVDVERMEEAKMELMRTAKCPDNQGVPVLILANKQDLPGARDSKELEKLLGLQELLYPAMNLTYMSSSSSSTGNIVGCSTGSSCEGCNSSKTYARSVTPTSQHNKLFSYGVTVSSSSIAKDLSIQFPALSSSVDISSSNASLLENNSEMSSSKIDSCKSNPEQKQKHISTHARQEVIANASETSLPTSIPTTPTPSAAPNNSIFTKKHTATPTTTTTEKGGTINSAAVQFKGWYIQPACAITGEGLQEGLEALYEMILKRRKLNKAYKRKR